MKDERLEIVTFLITETNMSFTVTPLSTTAFTFMMLSRKITTAPFIQAVDFTLLWLTACPTARLQSSTEWDEGTDSLMPCFLVSLLRSMPAFCTATSKALVDCKKAQTHTHEKNYTVSLKPNQNFNNKQRKLYIFSSPQKTLDRLHLSLNALTASTQRESFHGNELSRHA